MDPEQSSKMELANLRLQVVALSEKISAASLPDQIRSLRRAILTASICIAFALMFSAIMYRNSATKELERRVERLERLHLGQP